VTHCASFSRNFTSEKQEMEGKLKKFGFEDSEKIKKSSTELQH
jgi:hypothetical protein